MRHRFAILNEQGRTIWTRSGTASAKVLLEALRTLQAQCRDEPLYLVEGIEDTRTHLKPHQRLALPFVKAKSANFEERAVVVEVWHRLRLFGPVDDDYFGTQAPERVAHEGYTKVGEFLAPASDPLESVYSASQNLEASWRPGTPTRSTSVGDMLVVKACSAVGGEEKWRVMSVGFSKVKHFD